MNKEIEQKIESLRPHYPTAQALLLPLLHELQAEKGWLSCETMKEAGQYLNLPLSKVKEVVSFYTMFNQEPVGQFHLQICNNISCWLNGSEHILEKVESLLGVKAGETTSDQHFTISEVECLASCGSAPVMQVNDKYYEHLSLNKIESLISSLKLAAQKGDLSAGRTEA